MADDLLAYYSEPGPFTTLGPFAEQVDALPSEIGALARAVQMLLVHRWWADAYRVEVTPEREKEMELHSTEAMLAQAMRLADTPIGGVRIPDKRVVGICRHFSTMMAAFLKRKGVPARARCGFATYFQPGKYVDHWVAEYWNAGESRWVQVDAQLDSLQRQATKADFDPLDTPRDRFLVAGDVWRQYRAGKIDASTCGIAHMWGDWFIRGNHALDVGSLQRMEFLPWEPFGTAKSPESTTADTPELLAIVDKTAELATNGDDASIAELLEMAGRDERLRPPAALLESAARNDAAEPADRKPFLAGFSTSQPLLLVCGYA
jgi:hypothetical protein